MNEYGPQQLLFDLLTHKRASANVTKDFISMKHNDDLCPAILQKLDQVLQAFSKYRQLAFDVQGLRDEGTDVLVRLPEDAGEKYVCLQIKSEPEIPEKGLIDKLILQWQRSVDRYVGMEAYYILLCCDATKHANRVRDIQAAFSTKPDVFVIEPQLARSFLRYSRMATDALVRAKVGQEDITFREALRLSADLTPSEIAILLYASQLKLGGTSHVSISDLRSDAFITATYDRIPDYGRDWYSFLDDYDWDDESDDNDEGDDDDESGFIPLGHSYEERIADDLNYLDEEFLSFVDGDTIELDLSTVKPLILMLLDGEIRYDYEGLELLTYALELLAARQLELASLG